MTSGGSQSAPNEAPEPAQRAEPESIHDLVKRWMVFEAELELDILEAGHGQDTIDRLISQALERFRGLEEAILATEPRTAQDLRALLDLARKIIGNDDYAEEQEERAHQMLDLLRRYLI